MNKGQVFICDRERLVACTLTRLNNGRGDGLARLFGKMVPKDTVKKLIADGYLLPDPLMVEPKGEQDDA